MFLMNMDTKIFDQIRFILVNLIQQYVKRIIPHDQVGFIWGMCGWFNIWKLVNIVEDIKGLKEENFMSISVDAEKAFNNTQYPSIIKKLSANLDWKGTFLAW